MSVVHLGKTFLGGKTYPIEVFVVDVALLERTLDLLLRLFGQRVKAVDQFNIVLCGLPPVVKDRRRDTSPVLCVSDE